MKSKRIVRLFVVALFALILIGGFGQAVLHLWNALMPDIFGLHPISFWQAVGLLALSWILFGGLGMFRGGPHYAHNWRHRISARLEQLPPEQRDKLLCSLENRCGRGDTPANEAKA